MFVIVPSGDLAECAEVALYLMDERYRYQGRGGAAKVKSPEIPIRDLDGFSVIVEVSCLLAEANGMHRCACAQLGSVLTSTGSAYRHRLHAFQTGVRHYI